MNILDEFLNSLLSTINFNQSDEAVISQLNLLEEQVRNIAQQNDSLGHFYQGQYLTVGQLNGVIAESIKRLKLLFSYSQAAETKIVNRLNNTVVTINNVSSEAKRIGTKLKRLMLNNGIGLINFIEDFASSENIENESTMSIDFIESAATLPIESQTSLTPRSIEFNTNGVVGSNNEVGRLLSGDSINNLLDNNLGTWFEVESLDGPVELTISYTFETAELVNFIRIVPVLFSTGNPLKIKDIKFITATQEEYSLGSDIITLVSDENSGTFSFSTHPCTLKKIIFVFKQDNPYLIQTPRGVVNRYAIGLKELSVYRIAYKTQGNVILKLPDNQTVESFKVNYEHKDLNLFSESVSFSKDKISLTSEPNQDSKFLHLTLQRKDSAFSNPLTFFSKNVINEENVPLVGNQFKIEKPNMFLPVSLEKMGVSSFGAVGRKQVIATGSARIIDTGLDLGEIEFDLFVDGVRWDLIPDVSILQEPTKAYSIDGSKILFGDGLAGQTPLDSSIIEIQLPTEKVRFISPELFELEHLKDGKPLTLFKKGRLETSTVVLRRRATVHNLNVSPILSLTGTGSLFQTEKTFVNGLPSPEGELEDEGDYSVDYERGILYTFSRTSGSTDVVVSFTHQNKTLITDFNRVFDDPRLTQYTCSPISFPSRSEVIPSGSSFFQLQETHIIRDSESFSRRLIPVQALRNNTLNLGAVTSGVNTVSVAQGIDISNINFSSDALTLTNVTDGVITFTSSRDLDSAEASFIVDEDEVPRYQLNHEEGLITFRTPLTESLRIIYRYSDVFAEYSIGKLIPVVSFSGGLITLDTDELNKYPAKQEGFAIYKTIVSVPQLVEPKFYTPVVNSIEVKTYE